MLNARGLLSSLAGMAVASAALGGSGSVQFEPAPMALRYRVTLGGRFGEYSVADLWPLPGQAELRMSVEFDQTGNPSGVVIQEASWGLAAPHVFGVSFAPFGSVFVTLADVQYASSAPGLTIPVSEAGAFAATGLAASSSCHLSYATHGTQCGQLLGAGSPCEFNGPVVAAAASTSVSGTIFREPFEPDWSFELRIAVQSPLHPEQPAGDSVEIWATLRGTISEFAAVCPEDWDSDDVVTVQDIFSFLTAWFAGDTQAQGFGGTPGVPAIFAFLTAWFAHAPGPC